MSKTDFRSAVRDAISEEMRVDPTVVLFSEDVGAAGGVFQATRGLRELFGDERVFDTPISELALAGAAFGAAISGLRPIIEVMFGDFTPLVMDSLINQAAKYQFLTGGSCGVPLVVRSAVGGGGRFGAIHSQIPAPWLNNVPGIKIVAPSTPSDARALLRSAIRDDNPVVFLEHKRLYNLQGECRDEAVAIGSAAVVRPGRDVTIAAVMTDVHKALSAADRLAHDGVSAEVIDLRTLRPLDLDTVVTSAKRTGKLVVVEEGPRTGGWAAELVASVSEQFGDITVWRVTSPDSPLPYSPPLEDATLPSAERIAESVLEKLRVSINADKLGSGR
jgi:pyruvate/2-oxoglutarate/acetoin dehydrogenase E1 component